MPQKGVMPANPIKPPPRKPGGPNQAATVYFEPKRLAELRTRAKGKGWSFSREVRWLVDVALEHLAAPTADRVTEIMRTTGVGRDTAARLAGKERERAASTQTNEGD